jgi:hypothetical protein
MQIRGLRRCGARDGPGSAGIAYALRPGHVAGTVGFV